MSLTFFKQLWVNSSNQTKGTALCLLGVLIITPDSLLVRKVSHLANFEVMFYRYLLFTLMIGTILFSTNPKLFVQQIRELSFSGYFTAIIWAGSNLFITLALQNAPVANVLVINAANPMFSALFSWLILREGIPLRTILASIVCFGAIFGIFYSQMQASSSLKVFFGHFCALLASISMGLYFVLLRYIQQSTGKEPNAMIFNMLAGFIVSIISVCFNSSYGGLTGTDMTVFFMNGAVILPLAFYLLSIGPNLISAPEVSLYTLIETVLGPIWVWLGGYEAPPFSAIFGGLALFIALTTHSYVAILEADKENQQQNKDNKFIELREEENDENNVI